MGQKPNRKPKNNEVGSSTQPTAISGCLKRPTTTTERKTKTRHTPKSVVRGKTRVHRQNTEMCFGFAELRFRLPENPIDWFNGHGGEIFSTANALATKALT